MRTVWVALAVLVCSGATLATPPNAIPPKLAPSNALPDVPLVDAVRRGDADAVRALLDGGAFVGARPGAFK